MTFGFSHDHVGITVTHEDLEATIAWYARHLGFGVERRFASHGTTFVFLTAGGVRIELLAGAVRRAGEPVDDVLRSMDPSRLHHSCLAAQDLDAAVSWLRESGVPLVGGPMDVPAIGRRIAFVTDNVGTVIELSAPSGPAPGRETRR
jgi:catechol 2,3-dioxygenase-like lactoylglutathione lyase family enzyme